MLNSEAEFGQAGSTAYLHPSGQRCRILQRLPGNVAIISEEARTKGASASRRVPMADLFETAKDAQRPQPKRRRAA